MVSCMITSVNKHIDNLEQEIEPIDSGLMPYINAAKDQYPSKEELLAEVNQQRAKRQKQKTIIKSTLAVSLVALSIWTINPPLYSETYTTKFAQRMDVTLPDGSGINLNSNSQVVVKLRVRSRELLLTRGEASFNVKHGLRPFIVNVNDASVLDIGTMFNIQKWDDYFVTTVEGGVVEVRSGETQNILKTGESLKVTGRIAGVPYLADLDMVTAWQSGKIMFNGTTLKDAISQIQRYRKANIVLDSRADSLRLSGSYDINKIEPLLDSLPSMFPVVLSHNPNGEIQIRKNN